MSDTCGVCDFELAAEPAGEDGTDTRMFCPMCRIAALEKVTDGLPKTLDGAFFDEYQPKEGEGGLWCLWRYEDTEPWRVGKCHVPEREEWDLCFDFIVEDSEDECEWHGPYSTHKAAGEALAALDQKGEA